MTQPNASEYAAPRGRDRVCGQRDCRGRESDANHRRPEDCPRCPWPKAHHPFEEPYVAQYIRLTETDR